MNTVINIIVSYQTEGEFKFNNFRYGYKYCEMSVLRGRQYIFPDACRTYLIIILDYM